MNTATLINRTNEVYRAYEKNSIKEVDPNGFKKLRDEILESREHAALVKQIYKENVEKITKEYKQIIAKEKIDKEKQTLEESLNHLTNSLYTRLNDICDTKKDALSKYVCKAPKDYQMQILNSIRNRKDLTDAEIKALIPTIAENYLALADFKGICANNNKTFFMPIDISDKMEKIEKAYSLCSEAIESIKSNTDNYTTSLAEFFGDYSGGILSLFNELDTYEATIKTKPTDSMLKKMQDSIMEAVEMGNYKKALKESDFIKENADYLETEEEKKDRVIAEANNLLES